MNRIVEDHEEETFEVIDELLMDETIKFHMLAGKLPVLRRVKEELTKYWVREAKKGRSIEERARFKITFCFIVFNCCEMNYCNYFSK